MTRTNLNRFGTLIAIWAGSFWVDHHDVPHLLIAGLIVHAAGG